MRRTIGSRPLSNPPGPRPRPLGVTIETHLVPGHVVDVVIGLIKRLNVDLLVVGFMGHSRLYERIIGGAIDRLVRLAPCVVLVVK